MKRILVLAAIVAALLALPAQAGPGPLCDPDCTIASAGAGYVSPVAILPSGGKVTWESLDASHINADGVSMDDPECFFVGYGTTGPSAQVTFRIETTGLTAQVGDEVRPCVNASETAAGYVLPYYCTLHPTMRGTLIVTDE